MKKLVIKEVRVTVQMMKSLRWSLVYRQDLIIHRTLMRTEAQYSMLEKEGALTVYTKTHMSEIYKLSKFTQGSL